MNKGLEKAFFQRRQKMANVYRKMCLTSLIIRKMEIKTTMKYHLTSIKMAIIKKIREKEHICGCQGGGGGSGVDWEFRVNRCKLLHLEWISNEILLCSTGNYDYSLMTEHDNVQK